MFGQKKTPKNTVNFVSDTGGKYWCPFDFIPREGEIIHLGKNVEYQITGWFKVSQVRYVERNKDDNGKNTIYIHILQIPFPTCRTCKKELDADESLTQCHDCHMLEFKEKLAKKEQFEKELGLR